MSSGKSVDDVIMCLMGMGFELEDCQEAVQRGKLSVNQAVEWLLAGKPRENNAQPNTLQLRPPQATAVTAMDAFSNPVSTQESQMEVQEASAASHSEPEDKVVSRMHLSEKERDGKAKYEAQLREEARKKAKAEKLAERKAKEAALQQIKDDQERRKALKASAENRSATSETSQASVSSTPSTSTAAASSAAASSTTLLQIRLPDGRALRRSFPVSDNFRLVWTFLQETAHNYNVVLVQPFPRREFGQEDMDRTLQELGLFPSCSLVAKPLETRTESNTGAAASLHTAPEHPAPVEEEMEEVAPQEAMDEEEDDSDDEDVAMNAPMAPPQMGGFQLPGLPGMPMPQQGNAFWGEGQALDSRPADLMEHQSQDPQELARQRALERHRNAPAVAMESKSETALAYQVPSLCQQLIENVCSRICDTAHPIAGLQGLPQEIAGKVIDYLVKERKLNPKTLHPFISCHLQKLVLDCYPYITNELLAALRFHTYLSHISLASCPLINDAAMAHLLVLRRLKYLSLAKCSQLTDNCVATLSGNAFAEVSIATSFSDMQSLVTLVLEGTAVTNAGLETLALKPPPDLQALNLKETKITNGCLKALRQIQTLRNLNLENTKLSSLSGIEDLKLLETLNISGTDIQSEALLLVSRLKHVTALNVGNTDNVEGDVGLQYLSGMPLQLLTLPSRLTTTNAGLMHLSNMLLQSLDLTNYINIGDDGCQAIGRLITLKKLFLSNTKVTDYGIFLIKGLSKLQVLHVDKTKITDNCAEIFHNFTQLNDLSLANTSVYNDLILGDTMPWLANHALLYSVCFRLFLAVLDFSLTSKFLQAGALQHCVSLTKLNLNRTAVCDAGLLALSLKYLALLSLDGTMCTTDVILSMNHLPSLQNVMYNNLVPKPRLLDGAPMQ